MDNQRTFDPLFGARHPEVSITHVSPLEDDGFAWNFSYQVDGKFFCRVSCDLLVADDVFQEDAEYAVRSRAIAGAPPSELYRGSFGECMEEVNALYRFLLTRWRDHIEGEVAATPTPDPVAKEMLPAPKLPDPDVSTRREGVALSFAGLALLVAIGSWVAPERESFHPPYVPQAGWHPPSQEEARLALNEPRGLHAEMLQSAVFDREEEELRALEREFEPLRDIEPEPGHRAVPIEVEVPAVFEPPQAALDEVTPAEEVAAKPAQGKDLLAAFGVPEPKPAAEKEVEMRLRNEWKTSKKHGASDIPEPGSLVAQGIISPLAVGGGSLEDLSEIMDFGFEP